MSIIPLIRCLGNLSSGPEHWIDGLVASRGILNALGSCVNLDQSHHAVLKESVWVLANLLGGSERQRTAVLDAGSFEKIVPALYCDFWDVQRGIICPQARLSDYGSDSATSKWGF